MRAKPTIPGRLEKRSKLRLDERQFRRQAGIEKIVSVISWFELR